MNLENKSIAFFDFDGTITNGDSFLQFLIYTHGMGGFMVRLILLFPVLILYKLKLINAHDSKTLILSFFYKNKDYNKLVSKATEFSKNILPKYQKAEAMERIQWHINQQHTVVVVSASFGFILKGWCESNKLELIATEVESVNGKLTGKMQGQNCWGPEKANRIRSKYNLNDYSTIFAYGNSRGDNEMLELAHHAYFKTFN
jgi:phosphatidylglycerophosphatase C